MCKWNKNRNSMVAAAAAVTVLGLWASSASAAVVTWANTGTDFNTLASWGTGSGPVPGINDVATFTGAKVSNPNLSSSLTIQGVSFSTAASSGYTLSASPGQSLTLSAGTPITDSITSGTNIISANLILSGAKTFSGVSGGTTVIQGNITQGTSGTAIGLSGGSSIWTFSGNNNYSGGTTINNSGISLNIGSATALGTGALTQNINTPPTIKNTSGASLTIANAMNFGSAAGNAIVFAGPNDLTINGTVTLSAGGSASVANTQKITTSSNSTLTLAGTVVQSGGTKGLVKDGSGTLVLSGSNTYAGSTTVTASGTGPTTGTGASILQFAKEASLYGGNTTNWTASNITVSGTAYGNQCILALNVGGTGEFTSSDIDILKGLGTATTGFLGGASIGFDTTNASVPFVYNSNVSNTNAGANALGVTKFGANTMTLGGTNTYTGMTSVKAGTLQFSKQVALYNNGVAAGWATTNIDVKSGATLAVNVGGTGEFTSANLDTLKGLGSATGGFESGSILGIDTTNASGGSFTYGSVIANPNAGANVLGLTKLGTNTLVLSGVSSYTGATTVAGGKLVVGNGTSGSIANSAVTVNSGAALGGSGTTGAVTIMSGGILAPGNSIGTLNVAALDVSAINGTGGLQFELGANHVSDKVVATGALTLGTLDFTDFTFTPTVALSSGNTYTLLHGTSLSGTLGTASGSLGNGATGLLSFSGNDVVLTVSIPEPATIGLAIGAASLGLLGRRRRLA